jgi:hypothetical protein
MTTGAYMTDTPALLPVTSLSHLVTARVVNPDGEVVWLDVEDARSTWDATRTPRVTADLTVRLPTDQALLDRLDPRLGSRLILSAGYRRPDGLEDVQQIADLALRSRYVDRPSDTLRITAASDEVLLVDGAAAASVTVAETNVIDAIKFVVGQVFIPTWNVTATNAGGTVNEYTLDADRAALVNDYRDRIGAVLYADESRVWNIADQPTIAATPDHTMTTGEGGTIVASNAGLDRDLTGADGWYNRVYLFYRWRDAAGTEQRVQVSRSVTTGPYAVTNNLRTLRLERNVATTAAQAGAVAAAIVARSVTRGRTFNVTGVAAYWLRPDMTVAVRLPLGALENHLVASVTFDHRAGTMGVSTRLPDNAGTIA